MSIVTFGWSASNSCATSSHNDRPGSLFWMCHHSMVTGSFDLDSSPEPAPDAEASESSSSPPHEATMRAATTSSAVQENLRRMDRLPLCPGPVGWGPFGPSVAHALWLVNRYR